MISHEPIERRKLSDSIQERLLSMIWNGDVVLGDPLPSERELMETFRVGRPAVREALQNLQRMGLVEIRHGERAKVAVPSFSRMVGQMSDAMRHLLAHSSDSLEHLKEARAVFEAAMARIAAGRRKSSDIKRLSNLLATQASFTGDLPRFLEWDGMLHREIAAISGNPIFVALSEALFRWLVHFHVDFEHTPQLEKSTLTEHEAVVAAIAAGDADVAAAAMANHLSRANGLYKQLASSCAKAAHAKPEGPSAPAAKRRRRVNRS